MPEAKTGSFEALLAQPDSHVVLDIGGDAPVLMVLFGGIAGGVSMPVFEFFRLTSTMPGKKTFLRDPRRGWYQLGIPGIGETAADIRRFLDDVVARSDVERVVMAGASAGGYAALLFGVLCGADEVLAFSPQTFIDPDQRAEHGDERWAPQIADLYGAMAGRAATLDLRDVLVLAPALPRLQVHVSNDDALDLVHARRLADIPGVEIIEHERGGHRLVKTLRDRGILQPLLLQALSGERATSGASHGE